jgi:hypothetical protein
MDTSETYIKETREVKRAGVYASIAGPKKLDIIRKDQEPDALPYASIEGVGKYARWGKKNKYPQEVVDLNVQDTTSGACLNFKIKAHYGKGLFLYKKEMVNGTEKKVPYDLSNLPEIEDFLFMSDIENYLQGVATDFEWWNWAATELIPDGKNEKIHSINRIKVMDSRMELQDEKGLIKNLFVSGKFTNNLEPDDIQTIPIFNKRQFFDPRNKEKIQKSVYIHSQPSVDRSYYPLPMWQSNNNFLNLSLEISDWILSNINNSINIKYHIEYPESYFEMLCPKSAYADDDKWLSAVRNEKDILFSQIDEYLAGTKNVGKYIHTYTMTDPRNPDKEIGFKIHVIENKTNHEAYLPAFDTSAAAIANAHNAPLDLVGLSLSKGMAGSGSNIRESFNFYMQLHTEVPRQTTLEALYLVKKINKWPADLHFGYKNIVFQSVNENKSGYANEGEANPTTTNKE